MAAPPETVPGVLAEITTRFTDDERKKLTLDILEELGAIKRPANWATLETDEQKKGAIEGNLPMLYALMHAKSSSSGWWSWGSGSQPESDRPAVPYIVEELEVLREAVTADTGDPANQILNDIAAYSGLQLAELNMARRLEGLAQLVSALKAKDIDSSAMVPDLTSYLDGSHAFNVADVGVMKKLYTKGMLGGWSEAKVGANAINLIGLELDAPVEASSRSVDLDALEQDPWAD